MSFKKWLIGAALIALSTGVVFANGAVEDDDYGFYGPRGGLRPETETVEGNFTLVDGEYPAIVTEEGETLYLMIHFPVEGDQIPREGADLKLEAVQSPMSPVHLMVLSAEVDGVEIESDWDNHGGPGMFGGRGGRGRPGMFDGRRGKPGWGYEEPRDN